MQSLTAAATQTLEVAAHNLKLIAVSADSELGKTTNRPLYGRTLSFLSHAAQSALTLHASGTQWQQLCAVSQADSDEIPRLDRALDYLK